MCILSSESLRCEFTEAQHLQQPRPLRKRLMIGPVASRLLREGKQKEGIEIKSRAGLDHASFNSDETATFSTEPTYDLANWDEPRAKVPREGP